MVIDFIRAFGHGIKVQSSESSLEGCGEARGGEAIKLRVSGHLGLPLWLSWLRIYLQCGRPGLGRSPGEGKGYTLQYSGLENSMDCIVHGVARIGHD